MGSVFWSLMAYYAVLAAGLAPWATLGSFVLRLSIVLRTSHSLPFVHLRVWRELFLRLDQIPSAVSVPGWKAWCLIFVCVSRKESSIQISQLKSSSFQLFGVLVKWPPNTSSSKTLLLDQQFATSKAGNMFVKTHGVRIRSLRGCRL